MCGDTVEFCIRMHFGRDFLGRSREGGGVFPSVSSVAIVRNSAARLTPRNYILRTGSTALLLSLASSLAVAVTYWNSRHPFRETYATIHVLNHVVIFSEKFQTENYIRVCKFASSLAKLCVHTEILVNYALWNTKRLSPWLFKSNDVIYSSRVGEPLRLSIALSNKM